MIYFLAFLSIWHQFRPLLGEKGLLPIPDVIPSLRESGTPTLFRLRYSDRVFSRVCLVGCAASLSLLAGLLDGVPTGISVGCWLLLWWLYLSIVNVGQVFFGYGWESMLLEMGFFVSFLGPVTIKAPAIPILLLRWMLFRTELGAGLIKLRSDPCWRNLTCLNYHYETQPLPNPLSRKFHLLPRWFHRASVAGSHFVQLLLPFGLFAPQPVATGCALLLIAHQLWLILCGNYAFLNWLTVVLGFSGLGDSVFGIHDGGATADLAFRVVLWALAVGTVVLSYQPALNLISKDQRMNCCYNKWRLVNSYGAFGSVTKTRYEVILEGTEEAFPGPNTVWREYEFKAKPGAVGRKPGQWAPYHLRLDWQMWFLPFTAHVARDRIRVYRKPPWFDRLLEKLLEGDPAVLQLLAGNPFPESRPLYVRALYYRYRFTTASEFRLTGETWHREYVGVYREAVWLTEPPVEVSIFTEGDPL